MASMAVCSVGSSIVGAAESVLARPRYGRKVTYKQSSGWLLRKDKRLTLRAEGHDRHPGGLCRSRSGGRDGIDDPGSSTGTGDHEGSLTE
jgi:hypothetical protein